MRKFKCKKCDGSELSYPKYVKSTMPVVIDEDENISYQQSIIDYDDQMPVNFGYVCSICGHQVYHAGNWLSTESELKWFLTSNTDVLDKQQREFNEHLEEQEGILEEQEYLEELYI